MRDEYGSDYITLIDEEGKEFELEHVDTIELGSETYMAFLPAEPLGEDKESKEIEDDEYGLILLKVVEEDGEEMLATLDSDEEAEYVYEKFMERLFDDEEDGEGGED
jgi:uncharacterized protein YrzB (UPF0473 family)